MSDIRDINFGSPDSAGDTNIMNYFYEHVFVHEVMKNNKFFILGRKGTGKTALFRYLLGKYEQDGFMCQNLGLTEFPFGKLSDFSNPDYEIYNKYTQIWEWLIYTNLSKLVLEDPKVPESRAKSTLEKYIKQTFPDDIMSYHGSNWEVIKKKDGRLFVPTPIAKGELGKEVIETKQVSSIPTSDIGLANSQLSTLISKIINHNSRLSYVLQFDGLDDTYNSEVSTEYYYLILGLFKVTYRLNNQYSQFGVNVRINLFLRTDIYSQFKDMHPDSAKWYHNTLVLNWAAVDKKDYANGHLRNLMNLRIKKTTNINASEYGDEWDTIFKPLSKVITNNRYYHYRYDDNTFKTLLQKTMHRPRDIINLCKCIQDEYIKSSDNFSKREYNIALTRYSHAFWEELCNELNTVFPDTSILYKFLTFVGDSKYTYSEFQKKYNEFEHLYNEIKIEFSSFVDLLYRFGIISNFDQSKGYSSIIREDYSEFKRDELIVFNESIISMLKHF